MSDEVLDDVMIMGSCKGKADAIVNCQCMELFAYIKKKIFYTRKTYDNI